ncbi:MAG: TonB-dependent receptor [Alphaproteobacteria bacterium]|nr:TonB-dependent receptor [Alphaproteobacteria bacterium]
MRKILLASVALIASPAFADETTFDAETVVVTATRTPQPLEVTGSSMSVITSDDLAVQQTVVVTDILAETPGLTVVRNGGPGQTTTVSIRGAEAGQTLALIDGVRINDPSSVDDQAILGDLMVNNVDRIEVLRGPQSTLYGSDAIGGVVDVLTKRGGDAPFAATASAEGGSFDTWRLNAGANGTISGLEYGAALNYFDTGGISAADEKNGNPEADGTRNFGATMNTRYHVTDALSLDLRGYYTQSHTEIDGFPPPNFTFQDDAEFGSASLVAGYAGVNLALMGGRFQNRLAFIASESERKFFGEFDFFTNAYSPAENFFAKGDATRIEYQGIFDLDKNDQLTFGAETQRVGLSTQSLQFDPGPTTGSRRTTGYYAQIQSTLFDQLTLTGGVRLEDDDEFGTHTSVKVAGAWNVPGYDTTLRANYGDGFKAPTLYQLFSQYKNPFHDLKPETANGWEVGIDHFFLDGQARASLTWFERRTHNQIDFLPTSTFPFGYYENLERTRADGVEAEVEMRLSEALSVSADYTNMATKDLITGLDLARRPDNAASATVTWQATKDLSLGGTIVFVGPRFDDRGNFTRLANNTTVNLFGSYTLIDKTALFARVENLLGQDNEPVFGYGRPGTAAYAGIRTAF